MKQHAGVFTADDIRIAAAKTAFATGDSKRARKQLVAIGISHAWGASDADLGRFLADVDAERGRAAELRRIAAIHTAAIESSPKVHQALETLLRELPFWIEVAADLNGRPEPARSEALATNMMLYEVVRLAAGAGSSTASIPLFDVGPTGAKTKPRVARVLVDETLRSIGTKPEDAARALGTTPGTIRNDVKRLKADTARLEARRSKNR